MSKRTVSGIMLTLLVVGMLMLAFNAQPVKTEPGTIIVPDDYPTIHQAVNAAESGDVIYVRAGTYYGGITIDKDRLTLIGDYPNTTIISERTAVNVVTVKADNVKISGFIICSHLIDGRGIVLSSSSTNSYISNNIFINNYGGIIFEGAFNNTFADNIVTGNCFGISLVGYSSENLILNNTITNNSYGIWVWCAYKNTFKNNNMTANSRNFGIGGYELSDFINDIDASNTVNGKPVYYLIDKRDLLIDPSTFPNIGYLALINSTNITIKELTLTNNDQGILLAYVTNATISNINVSNNNFGIHLYESSNSHVSTNNLTNNSYGIWLEYSSRNIFTYNNVEGNSHIGINLWASSNNTFIGNNVTNTGYDGIYLWASYKESSDNNVFISNNIKDNGDLGICISESSKNILTNNNIENNHYGIRLRNSYGNVIYHNNFIQNQDNAWISEGTGINIWDNGYPLGGNYWSDYTGVDLYSGPYQDETGSDGVGDAPYVIDENNIDRYPLMNRWAPTPPVITATVNINPDALNLRSRGKWITALIELPEGYNVAELNVSSLLLNDTIPAEMRPFAVGDYDEDSVPDLMVKFNRQAVTDLVLKNYQFSDMFGTITLTVTGKLYDGTLIQGSDTIRIILHMPSGINRYIVPAA